MVPQCSRTVVPGVDPVEPSPSEDWSIVSIGCQGLIHLSKRLYKAQRTVLRAWSLLYGSRLDFDAGDRRSLALKENKERIESKKEQ